MFLKVIDDAFHKAMVSSPLTAIKISKMAPISNSFKVVSVSIMQKPFETDSNVNIMEDIFKHLSSRKTIKEEKVGGVLKTEIGQVM